MSDAAMNRLSRRQLLLRSGVAVVAIGASPTLLAACGGGDDAATNAGGGDAGTMVEEASAALADGSGEVGGAIDYLSWEGYDTPDAIKSWVDGNGVEINATYIATHDDIQAKILAADGGTGYDIITYYQGYKPLYQELDILQGLDPEKIPNLGGLYPYFQGDAGNFWVNADGVRTGVPWTFGGIGVTWNDKEISGGITSWYDFLDAKFKGKVAVVDDPTGNAALGSHILGLQPDKLNRDTDVPKLKDFFTQLLAQTKGVSASFGDATNLLVSGESTICFNGWSAINSFAADAGNNDIKTGFPQEGGYGFCDAFAIPTTADNAATAYSWINNILDPKVNAAASDFLVAATPVEAAVPLLGETTRALYPYDDIDAFLEKIPFYNNPPLESDEYMTIGEWMEIWTELKANAGS
ncbi:MAG: PotD/PotF family extracellular solute-binding protein [Actinomycetota bacterium]